MNDYYNTPVPSRQYKTDGTIVSPADGINSDGSRNVKVLGTYMEEEMLANVTVPAGTTVTLKDFTQDQNALFNYEALNVGIVGNSSHAFKLDFRPYLTAITGSDTNAKIFFDSTAVGIVGTRITLDAPRGMIRLQNKDAVDHTYSSIRIFKFRRQVF